MSRIARKLEEKYNLLFKNYDLEYPLEAKRINGIIRDSLQRFLKDSITPAIYCNGGHTQMLMADFMYDLKKVKYLVDNYAAGEDAGFSIIKDKELEEKGIDAVVLSTFKFREEVKRNLKENHPGIPVLDIYDEFEKNGIRMQADYYYTSHPYHNYHSINELQREIRAAADAEKPEKLKELGELYKKLLAKYIQIKDFRTALVKVREMSSYIAGCSEHADADRGESVCRRENACEAVRLDVEALRKDLEELYELEKQAAACVSEDAVLMLCLDALRYRDLSEQDMPKLKKLLDETAYCFNRAYSFSTSTFESLVPAYSENGDLRTGYYEKNAVDREDCRFIKTAQAQKRKIYIYGDVEHYIEGKNINYSDTAQTATEKFWDFLIDSSDENGGLFYLHEQYESHFTFSNPYTEHPIRSEGTALLFDFLPMKGGHLRTDYKRQHRDAIRYLDDVLTPFLEKLSCRMVLYADHGTLILDRDTELSEVENMEYICSEGWTRIPLAIRSPETGVGKCDDLISLMEIGPMVISLLKKENYMETSWRKTEHIKMARSELYNPDFRFLYGMIGKEQYLQAFECFAFEDGYKLVVFGNGYTELYLQQGDGDIAAENARKKAELFQKVRDEVTVCDVSKIDFN